MPLTTPRSIRPRRRTIALAAAVAGLAGSALAAPGATAATPTEVRAAVERGADYLTAQVPPSGPIVGFGGDWTLSALAAAGRDVDAIVPTAGGPSLLATYRTLWTSGPDGDEDWTTPSGPDPFAPTRMASDYAKAALLSYAAGLDPRKLAPNQNLLAQLAGVYHGRQPGGEAPGVGRIEGTFGNPTPMSTATGALFLLNRLPVPAVLRDTVADSLRSNQLDSGAWSWDRIADPTERQDGWRSDVDMTGQSVGALCDAGVRPDDPAIVRGLAYLADGQVASGGIDNGWAPAGDVNSTAAVVFALNACGIDPQGAAWTTGSGTTPIDFLVASQIASGEDAGGFPASFAPGEANLYASQEAVRALTGSGYVTGPTRTIAPPAVADGTVVPQVLVIDAGIDATGERDLRVCRVAAPVGASVTALLDAAATTAQPTGCVEALSVADGQLRALNGVTGDHPQRTWLVRIDGAPAQRAGGQPVCQGQIVSLYVGSAADATATTTAPCTAVVPEPAPGPGAGPVPQPPSPVQPIAAQAPQPRVTVRGASGTTRTVRLDRKGRLRVTLSCPKTATSGCWTVLSARATFRATPRGEARERRAGGRTIRLAAGRTRTVTVALSSPLRRDLRRVGQRSVRLIVRTHGSDSRTTSRTVTTVRVRPVAQRG